MGGRLAATTRANTRTSTDAAPARNNAREQASTVAPEVSTFDQQEFSPRYLGFAMGRHAKGGERSILLLGRDRREQPLAIDLQDVGHLGREHVVGAGALGLLDQPHCRIEIGMRRQARTHLDETRGEGRSLACAHAKGLSPVPAGASPRPSSGSSLPARSRAERSS